MSLQVALHHRTTYRYERPITLGPQTIRLRPAAHSRTTVSSYSLRIQPADHFLNWQQDPHGNFLARAVFPKPTRQLTIDVDLVASLVVINPFDFFLEPEANEYPFTYAPWLHAELQPYLQIEPAEKELREFLREAPRQQTGTVDFLVELNRYVHDRVKYLIRLEPGVQSCEETLRRGSGSCRDSAWLLVQTLRHLGLAARFVSGYLIQLKPDMKPLEGPSGAAEDFTDLHAWTEVYLPGAGWIGLDPTSGLLAAEGHIPLAATPDPISAAPLTGAVEKCESEFDFQMKLQRICETPRVTKPYQESDWQAVLQLGEQVDACLTEHDVRLTMGGEPTFVSSDDMEGEEWNSAALGENKRRLADRLFHRLAQEFARGPLLHFGQGKWYPGEPLPRWALACYWRADGEPIWRDPRWVADDAACANPTVAAAREFTAALAQRLQVGSQHVIPAYEDAWYYLWKERRLPSDVDPLTVDLKDGAERQRLAKLLDQGLGEVVGYCLPLRARWQGRGGPTFESGHWFLRQQHLFLLPGDSPLGLRLPLDAIGSMASSSATTTWPRDPFEPRASLPLFHNNIPLNDAHARTIRFPSAGRQQPLTTGTGAELAATADHSTSELVRTALCVEPRAGHLHVFMPPLSLLEEYLALVAAIEATAVECQLPVRIEGYAPPQDDRLKNFKVTPDPGVIEVNTQPAANWPELVHNTKVIYESARQTRLQAEKFMIDGRHTGTGGGNHLVLGGAQPSDSPFLRRPDLLGSMIAYWHNHPALSYLFSGLFIGPTSQAPRVDEARLEAVYELQNALRQLPQANPQTPWLVDRILRNLLVDLTGNTHRAEFCVDKLYSPDSATGRLGLLELRGFEMPPDARMSLAQQLLVRALVAHFWKQPYEASLVRWGTALHDRFMLPHFVAQDFGDVLGDLRKSGFDFSQDWFTSHFEFRFPLIGRIAKQGVTLELRQAIEPWHVLGEQSGGGGTVRYVDSSMERLQVKVTGLTDPRYVVTANGRHIPLQPTGTTGEYVAGVRFRAWQPSNCLHPLVGVHTPLVFDLIDTWNKRSVGGCTWHVAHPGGRNFARFPVNAYEAESRRVARFFAIGHSPGTVRLPSPERNQEYPFTLDLRQPLELADLGSNQRG